MEISVSGVPWREEVSRGSGEADAWGVGSGGGRSSSKSVAMDTREALLFLARASLTLRRLGGDFLVGDSGSSVTSSGGGLKTCDGSIDDSTVVRRAAVRLRVVASPSVFRLGDPLLVLGAGVNSSSSSSSSSRLLTTLCPPSDPSSSSSSTTTFLRVAARREGRTGESAMSVRGVLWCCAVSTETASALLFTVLEWSKQ